MAQLSNLDKYYLLVLFYRSHVCSYSIFLRFIYFYLRVRVRLCGIHVSAGTYKGWKMVSMLEWKLQVVVNCPVWALGPELRFCAIARTCKY